ncbi:ribonuclease BN (tRNA processing enzyme) [Bacillus mesophilus]|uniref:MBL fold metallo-hydrolase n=1 Tax=Bacillus mesophilus TaxID=1808955 RepID=A0A6M0Q301_9BACI|nr:MBL fold metallo-hydrolase [Bacillus mesophilus]MBM7659858.1 ribonuclease BN (tRNA processing enzyme) [Bacillus mesophilus]NEY70717.1 MBL fold metallo-hydrolase [Bacillus mesophilus]
MKLTVIGYWGGYPAKNEATSGYLFEDEDFKLLVDCGSGVISQLQNYINPENLDAVILSHYHHDHVCDLGTLQYARLIKGYLGENLPSLPVYGHQEDEPNFANLTYKEITTGVVYNPTETIQVGPFRISFLKTKHPAPCYAMRIETINAKVTYTADTSFFDEMISFAKDSDLLICECNLYKGMDGQGSGHMTSTDAGKLAMEAQVGEMLLTHLPHFGTHSDLIQEAKEQYMGKIELAKSGWNWKKE